MLTHLKSNISEDYISAPICLLRPQIFTRARKSPSFTIAPSTGDGGAPYNFFQKGVKNWLKMQ